MEEEEEQQKVALPWTAEQLWDMFGWSSSVLRDMMKRVVKVIREDDKSFPKFRQLDYSYEDWKFALQFFSNDMTREQRLRIRAMLAKMVQRGLDDDMFSSSSGDHHRVKKGVPALCAFQALLDEFLGEPSSVAVIPSPHPPPEVAERKPIFAFSDPVD